MSRFFTPVDFPELKKLEVQKVEVIDSFPEEATKLVVEFQKLFRAIESGESGMCASIQLKGSPALAALQRFSESPSAINLKTLLIIVEQDINRRVKQEMIQILKNSNKKVSDYLDRIGVK